MPDDGQLYIATNPSQLKQLAERLSRKAMLGVDTESNSLHAYKERLCLLQFSTDKEDAVVDPLTVEDLSPLSAIFANPAITLSKNWKIGAAGNWPRRILNGYPIWSQKPNRKCKTSGASKAPAT